MRFRPMFVLCILVLAGCTSSEPRKAAYAPPATAPSQHQAAPPVAHAALSAPGPQTQPGEFSPSAGSPPSDTPSATVLPPGATNCSTVDGVTLCDAPAESEGSSIDAYDADDTLYTN